MRNTRTALPIVVATMLALFALFVPRSASVTPPNDQTADVTDTRHWNVANLMNIGVGANIAFAANGWCPTNGEMMSMLGFDRMGINPVRADGEGDGCHWLWTGYKVGPTVSFFLPDGWQTTTTDADGVVRVYWGPVQQNVRGFTLRWKEGAAPFVSDACALFRHEVKYAQDQSPRYSQNNGNLPLGNC